MLFLILFIYGSLIFNNKKIAKNRIIDDAIVKLTYGVYFKVAKFKSIAPISPHMNPIPFSAIALPRYFLTT